MSADTVHRGGCLCGAVRHEVAGTLRPVVECHCTQCRRTTGHHLAATVARGLQIACHVHVTDKGPYYEIADGKPQISGWTFTVPWS